MKKDVWFYSYRSALKKIVVLGLTFLRKEIGFSFGESIKFRYLNLLMKFYEARIIVALSRKVW